VTNFDLLFLLSALATVVMVVAAAICLLRGRHRRALGIFKILAVCVASYCALAVATDLLRPQRSIAAGEPWCFDDWCLQVESFTHASAGPTVRYTTQLRIFSTARGISQRAAGAWIYLIDKEGRRYPPNADPTATPLTVRLAPEQSISTSRSFDVAADVHILGLITGHGGRYCGWGILIIGEGGCLFNRPTMIRLP
jgi:hypothetical protein